MKIFGIQTGCDGHRMGTERFTLHRPGGHNSKHNVNYVAGEFVHDDGVACINLTMIGRGFEGTLKFGYDGNKIIIFINDSEKESHVIHMYPKTEE